MNWTQHLIAAPILLPLVVGAILVPLDEGRRWLRFAIALSSAVAQLIVAVILVGLADGRTEGWSETVGVYVAANWPVPFGIALAVDRFNALMLVLAATLGVACIVFARAGTDRAGVHFQPLFQFLLMGVNGSFLTADLFNLFVFFEVMLAASYGLLLHGSGPERVGAGLHYVVVNLVASSFFLIGVALLYGVTGTLNMADVARAGAAVAAEDRMLFEAGAALLAVAFLIKAALWPLNFWLAPSYAAASAPVAAAFAIMTKVGVYIIVRLWILGFGEAGGESSGFGRELLLYGGMLTLAFGTVGILAANDLGRLAAYSLIVSSGTLLAAAGFDDAQVLAGAIYYMFSATLAAAALFLLVSLVERTRSFGAGVLAVTLELFESRGSLHRSVDEPAEESGVVIPAAMAFLGLTYVVCALLISGLPPLSGFIAKFALLHAVLNPAGFDVALTTAAGSAAAGSAAAIAGSAATTSGASAMQAAATWSMLGLLVFSGLAAAIALGRIGIRTFWVQVRQETPQLRVIEAVPIAALLLMTVALTVQAGPVLRYAQEAALSMKARGDYSRAVLSAPQLPSPTQRRGDAAGEGPPRGAVDGERRR